MRLDGELKEYGFGGDVEEYHDILAVVFANMCPNMTDEQMTFDEFLPKKFVEAVRNRARCPGLPHAFILRTLTNMRKYPKFEAS